MILLGLALIWAGAIGMSRNKRRRQGQRFVIYTVTKEAPKS